MFLLLSVLRRDYFFKAEGVLFSYPFSDVSYFVEGKHQLSDGPCFINWRAGHANCAVWTVLHPAVFGSDGSPSRSLLHSLEAPEKGVSVLVSRWEGQGKLLAQSGGLGVVENETGPPLLSLKQ